MGSLSRLLGPGLVAASIASAGCAVPVRVESFPAEPLRQGKLALLAVNPLPAGERTDPEQAEAGARIVTARLLEELERRPDLEVVSPHTVRQALEPAGLAGPKADAGEVGALVARTFGADAVLSGRLVRYYDRRGSERGSARPAAVTFELALRTADGMLVWRGVYDERQQSLSDEPLSFRRAFDRGFRWVTAEQLAAYGAREIVRKIPAPEPLP
jgi:hypothetical protein